jgi:MFS family permease
LELSTDTEQERRTADPDEATPSHNQGRPRPGGVLSWLGRRPASAALILALVSATWAVAGSKRLFPYLSEDHDEGLYLLQARALSEGHLFPPAPEHADAFLPWLSVLSEGRFVLKYSPVHAAVLAAGELLGSARWSLGLIAGGVVGLSYLLAKEVLDDRRAAVLASLFLALSPLFLVQSATFLPYCAGLLLLEAFTLTLLRGMRTRRPLLFAASGFLFGVALFARPYDTLVFSVPLGVYFLVVHRRDRPALVRNAGWMALGVALPLLATFAYYEAATGSPFKTPFSLVEPRDTLGFGTRKLLPSHPDLIFTPARGWYGVGRYVLMTSLWGFGGLVLIGLFVAYLGRRRLKGPQPWLALVIVSFALGYLFFWGTYGTSFRGALTSYLGPFYFLPVLLPVTLLAARSFVDFWRYDRALAVVTMCGMVLVSGYLVLRALEANRRLTREDRRVYAPLAGLKDQRSLVLLPGIWGPHLLHPFASLQNAAHYDGRTVYALDRGDPRNLELIADYPRRAAYRFHLRGAYRANPPDPGLTTWLERLTALKGSPLRLGLNLMIPTADPRVVVSVSFQGRKESLAIDRGPLPGTATQLTLDVGSRAVGWAGPSAQRSVEPAEPGGPLVLSVSVGPVSGPHRTVYQRELGYTIEGESVTVLMPGATTVNELRLEEPLVVHGAHSVTP